MRLIAALAAVAFSVSTLPAADIAIRDLRVAVGVTPGPHSTDEDYTAGSGSGGRPSGSTTYHASSAQALDLYAGFAGGELHDYGLVYGIGLDAARGRFTPRGTGAGGLDYLTLVPQIRAGLGYAFSTSFHIELTPFLGYGLAITDWPDAGKKETGYGTALTYGVLAGGFAKLGEGWRIGVDFGYQGGMTNASVTNGTTHGQSDLTMHASGVAAHIIAGYEF